MRKLPTFYGKVTDFLWESYLISKTLQVGGVCGLWYLGAMNAEIGRILFTLFCFLGGLLTIF